MVRVIKWIAQFLSALAALNWGAVIFFNCNCVDYLNNLVGNALSRKVVYLIIALSGLYTLVLLFSRR